MPSQTLRCFAASRFTYAVALEKLTLYARDYPDDFDFGKLDLDALLHQGLTVTGPDLSGVAEMLADVPGLSVEEEQP